SCHTSGGTGPIALVDRNDVNVAFAAASSVVDLANPAASPVVAKVAGGHNCWESSPAACRVQMISYIERWAAAPPAAAITLQLSHPLDRQPPGAKTFPAIVIDLPLDSASSDLYRVLRDNCRGCHAEDSAIPQRRFFASIETQVAFDAV